MATNPFFDNPPAYMGYVGFVNIDGNTVRATSADIKLTQEVTKPDVVDGHIDRTVYQLGPQEVGGSIAFPALYDTSSGATTVDNLWRLVIQRVGGGTLTPFPVDIKYAQSGGTSNQSDFSYDNCVVNTMQFSVTQSDVMNITCDIIGMTRSPNTAGIVSNLGNSRIVTWADARFVINQGTTSLGMPSNEIPGQHVRSFEVNINNNVERFYTLNGALFAQAIAPAKRDVTGNVVFLGRLPGLGELAENNEDRESEDTTIDFGFETTSTTSTTSFIKTLPNVVFQIEEMAITNNLFETTVMWHSLPAARLGVTDPLL